MSTRCASPACTSTSWPWKYPPGPSPTASTNGKPSTRRTIQIWQGLRGLAEQFAFLERLLSAHIIAFAEGVGWQIPERFELKILDLLKREWLSYKDLKVLAFTMDFQVNVTLPEFFGIGEGGWSGFWGSAAAASN